MEQKYRTTIPSKYWKGNRQPKVQTVGKLKKLLKDLPDELPVVGDFEEDVSLVVYNVDHNAQVRFERQ